jgi:probable F420-dependent oxidoreductase
MTLMAFIAGATTRIRVSAGVLVLPYHHPVSLAKAISTLDVVSGGRINVAIGVGHAKKEFETLGVPFGERGRITDEALEVMRLLWTVAEPVHHGRYFDVDAVVFEPRPVQSPHPPIWIGGNSEAALRRAARHDGWIANPIRMDLAEIPVYLDRLRSHPDFQARTGPFEVAAAPAPFAEGAVPSFSGASPADLAALAGIMGEAFGVLERDGVTSLTTPLPPIGSLGDYLEFLHWFAEEMMPAFPAL